MNYRREIDGLRALAVLPVVLFHAGAQGFGGGFVGVDVFFVISGYLITTIIAENIEKGRFSLLSFYERRARRILPALFVMLAVSLLASWFLFLPGAHKVVGQYVVSSVFSASNILLHLKSDDYFGLEHGRNPLFHTWSLGVEEQFYLLVPLVLITIWSSAAARQLAVVATIIVASLGVSLAFSNDASLNFYMVFSRAWELGVGMLAAVIRRKHEPADSAWLSVAGLILLVASVMLIPGDHPLLHALMILPVTGAFLVIVFASENNVAGRLLALRPLVFVGLISYSLYLWHVPLLIYVDYAWGSDSISRTLYFLALPVVSWLSYRWVETPFRTRMTRPAALGVLAAAAAALVLSGLHAHLSNGTPDRSALYANLQPNNGWGGRCNGNTAVVPFCSDSEVPNVAVLGNSYAMSLVNALRRQQGADVVQLTQDSCPLGYIREQYDVMALPCDTFYRQAVATISAVGSIQTVVLSSPFERELGDGAYRASFLALISDLKGRRVVVIGPPPHAPFDVGQCLVRATLFGGDEDCAFVVPAEHSTKIRSLAEALRPLPNVTFVDITAAVCPEGRCTMRVGTSDGMYIDSGHLTATGAALVVQRSLPADWPSAPP